MRWYNVHHGFHCAKLVICTLTKHYLFNEKISWERNTIGRDIGMLITPMYKPKNIIFKARKDCPVETMLPGEFQIGHETKLLLKEIRTSTVFWLLKHFGTDAISSVVKQSSKDITRFLTDIIRHPVLIFRCDVMFWLRESLWTSRFGFTKKLRKLSTTIEKENFWMHRLNWHLLIISQDPRKYENDRKSCECFKQFTVSVTKTMDCFVVDFSDKQFNLKRTLICTEETLNKSC